MEMSLNTKLEIAIEIISAKIASLSNAGYTIENEEMRVLLQERDELYTGNEEIIDKIISVYGPEIKKNYDQKREDEDLER